MAAQGKLAGRLLQGRKTAGAKSAGIPAPNRNPGYTGPRGTAIAIGWTACDHPGWKHQPAQTGRMDRQTGERHRCDDLQPAPGGDRPGPGSILDRHLFRAGVFACAPHDGMIDCT